MTISKGDIYLVNLNPTKKANEMGKIRPVLVYQNDDLNHNDYPTTIVIPLSTQRIDDAEPIRMRIKKQDRLKEDSDLILTNIRAIDNSRFIEKLASLDDEQMRKVALLFEEIF